MSTYSTDHHLTAIRIARELLPSLGVSIPEELWREFSLDFDNETASFKMHQELSFYRRLIKAVDDPLLGLKFAKLLPLQAFGMFGFAFMSAPSFRAQLDLSAEFASLNYTLQSLDFREDGDEATVAFRCTGLSIEDDLKSFFADRDLGTVASVMPVLARGIIRIRRVTLEHADRGLKGEYERFFGCPVTFDSAENALIMGSKDLDALNPYRNAAAFEVCLRECRRQKALISGEDDIVAQVRRELFRRPGYLQDIDSVAGHLCASSRTLRRRLEQEGVNFVKIRQEVRYEQARQHLENSGLAISQIAELLGYTEPSNFTNAFKRWSGGVSPQAYRRGLAAA